MRLWELFSNPDQKIVEKAEPKKLPVKTLESRIIVAVKKDRRPR